MGRQIKRVALDFDWPANITWKGYLSPYRSVQCHGCRGANGYSQRARQLADLWYGWHEEDWIYVEPGNRRYNNAAWQYHLEQADVDALIAADRLWDFTRVPRTKIQRKDVDMKIAEGGNSWLPYDNGYRPTAFEVNEWAKVGMGHDSLNKHIVIEARCEREGVAAICDVCGGSGELWQSEEIRKAAEAWQPVEPPSGQGWQLWENVGEGSPITPVFASSDELVDHLANGGDAWGHSWTREQATAMVTQGFAPSGVIKDGKVYTTEELVLVSSQWGDSHITDFTTQVSTTQQRSQHES